MPLTCSCGTELPEDARFCFRCGKPQREEDVERFAPAAASVPPPMPDLGSPVLIGQPPDPQALKSVSFGNPLALRTALFIACLITALEIYPPFLIVAPLVGGFATVLLFQKRTGRILTTGAAVKLGWITAILNAMLGTVALTATALMEGSAFLDPLRQSIRQQASSPAQQQAIQLMNDPYFLGVVVLMAWLLYFVLISALCMAGGALGARLARPRTS